VFRRHCSLQQLRTGSTLVDAHVNSCIQRSTSISSRPTTALLCAACEAGALLRSSGAGVLLGFESATPAPAARLPCRPRRAWAPAATARFMPYQGTRIAVGAQVFASPILSSAAVVVRSSHRRRSGMSLTRVSHNDPRRGSSGGGERREPRCSWRWSRCSRSCRRRGR